MVAAVICSLCRPGLLGGEPTHHYGIEQGHTIPGVLGGWRCACICPKPGVPSEPQALAERSGDSEGTSHNDGPTAATSGRA